MEYSMMPHNSTYDRLGMVYIIEYQSDDDIKWWRGGSGGYQGASPSYGGNQIFVFFLLSDGTDQLYIWQNEYVLYIYLYLSLNSMVIIIRIIISSTYYGLANNKHLFQLQIQQ